jgi:DivIVA domain-containing protein
MDTQRTLHEVEFALRFRGYDTDEVDAFVDRVARSLDTLQRRLRDATERAERAEAQLASGGHTPIEAPAPIDVEATEVPPAPPAPAPALVSPPPPPVAAPAPAPVVATGEVVTEDAVGKVLVIAQRTADQLVSDAREQAHSIVSDAEAAASTIRGEADQYAMKVTVDADAYASKTTTDADDYVARISGEVEEEVVSKRSAAESMALALTSDAESKAAALRSELETLAQRDAEQIRQSALAEKGRLQLERQTLEAELVEVRRQVESSRAAARSLGHRLIAVAESSDPDLADAGIDITDAAGVESDVERAWDSAEETVR